MHRDNAGRAVPSTKDPKARKRAGSARPPANDALARIRRREQALDSFETPLAKRNPVGLLGAPRAGLRPARPPWGSSKVAKPRLVSEDLAPASGEPWGNFPRTDSVVGMVSGAGRLSAPWEGVV